MAKHFLLLLLLALFSFATESQAYSKTTPFHQGHKPEKLTHLHFYFHDVITGDKPTAIRVTKPAKINATTKLFGVVVVADNPLTEGPDPSSKEVGRAQGIYASTDMNIIGFTMLFNLAFTEGEFNGSTLAMYGRNPIMSKVREMPIIGGTGAFRLARGYAQAKTYMFAGFDAVVEYNVFIWH